jgi:glucosyl-dolichyl phosphate glucuronosyltransferase
MFVTVTIQTYNRAQMLAETLESLRSLRCPAGVEYEILVVDNNSADGTPEVIREYSSLLAPRLRSVFEPRQGLSHARNCALREAKGQIVSFLDDDVIVDPDWLAAVSGAFAQYSAAVVGGKSYLIYPRQKPDWLTAEHEELLSLLDHGDEVLVGTQNDLFGLNFSVRRDVAVRVGGFNPTLGRSGQNLASGEERELQDKIAAIGGVVVYEPHAIVGHIVAPERLTKRWFVRRVYQSARSGQRMRFARQSQGPSIPGLLRTCIRSCGVLLIKTLIPVCGKDRRLFSRQLDVVFAVGRLVEAVRCQWYA